MKILIISDAWHPQVNGVVRTYENLSEQLRRLGHEVKVIGPSDFRVCMPMPGYAEIQLAINPYGRLKRIIEAYQPDCIHIAAEGPLGWAGRKYCKKHNLKFSTSYHTHFPDYVAKRLAKHLPFLYTPIRNMAKKIILNFHAPSSAMMIATQSLEDELKSWGFKTPMHRLSRGAKLDMFYPGTQTLFNDLKRPVAIYVGRVAIEKNLEEFLAMDWAGSKVIVGDGPSRGVLSKKYPEAVFVGKKEGEELAAHYRSADLFAFPSRTDTFGIVLIEALASGLPVAAYNVTGPKDIITDKALGSLHENSLAAAAQEALRHGSPEERANHVKNYYTWENAGHQFEKALINNSQAN
jgi:glycosyltransferase involved in cell wall biosynthesis